jgi:protocatechuate 3,4-dioxygenase beta subunit
MGKHALLTAGTAAVLAAGWAGRGVAQVTPNRTTPLPECEWCGTAEAPPGLSDTAVLATANEPGERLIVEGTIYQADGQTPAGDVVVYAYHTNAAGVYAKRGDETGNGRRHGYLRGWLRTGPDGRYRIETIKPGTYPTRGEPAHLHLTLQPAHELERYIDDVVFDGDPLLTPEHRARLRQRGGSGIVRLARDVNGTLRATRDIYLGRQ